MAKRTSHGGAQATPPPPEITATGRQLHLTLAALHTGATAMAALGGLALYSWLAQWHVASLIAAGAGLLFALLGRIAAISIGKEWLVRSALRHRAAASRGTEVQPAARQPTLRTTTPKPEAPRS